MNYIADFKPLSSLPKLAYLNVARTSLTDVSPFMTMTQLKMLWLMNNKIEKSDLEKLVAALPECTISARGTDSTANGWLDSALYAELQEKCGISD